MNLKNLLARMTDASLKFCTGQEVRNFDVIFNTRRLCVAVVSNCSSLLEVCKQTCEVPMVAADLSHM